MFDSPLRLAQIGQSLFFQQMLIFLLLCKFIYLNKDRKCEVFPKHNRKTFSKMDILTGQRCHGRRMKMGQNRRFRSGQKAPNDGIYVEIGETGSMVKDPQMVKLTAGERFPENSNHNRQWTYKRKP